MSDFLACAILSCPGGFAQPALPFPVPLDACTGWFVLESLDRAEVEVDGLRSGLASSRLVGRCLDLVTKCSWCCSSRLNFYPGMLYSKPRHAAMNSGGLVQCPANYCLPYFPAKLSTSISARFGSFEHTNVGVGLPICLHAFPSIEGAVLCSVQSVWPEAASPCSP